MLDLKHGFGGTYAGLPVLVTGHTGFKGSWLCAWLQALGAEVTGLSLPAETPSHWAQLALTGVRHREVDLRDADALAVAVADARPRIVFHLAAQALVRRSYAAPADTFATNVAGLVNLYESLRRVPTVAAIVNATTDKVYRHGATPRPFVEDDPLGGHDPYSASKACAEIVTESWRASFFAPAGVAVATARAGNVVGGGDWATDRLVPDFVRAATTTGCLTLRHPEAVRPWQHVLEPLSGYLRLGAGLLGSEPVTGAWNFGPAPDATLTVGALADRMRAHWPVLETSVDAGPHPHEAPVLMLDCTRAASVLGWRPVWDAATTIERTIGWYRAQAATGAVRTFDDLAAYVADARRAGLGWAG